MADENPSPPASDAKHIWQSKGALASIIVALSGMGGLFGISLTPDESKKIIDAVEVFQAHYVEIAALFGGVVALWGRLTASSPIKSPFKKAAP